MALMDNPPTTTKYTFKKGDVHQGVWALQKVSNNLPDFPNLTADGHFGPATETAVMAFQSANSLVADGIVGQKTQRLIADKCVERVRESVILPKGLLEGMIQAESGGYIAAANSSVAGGIDIGYTQRRVYSPYKAAEVEAAFDSMLQIKRGATELYDRAKIYKDRPAVKSRSDRYEYAWRLAALAHNWPAAAEQLSQGKPLSETKQATWAPDGLKFPTGHVVYSYSDWAKYYAMGSKKFEWAGMVTQLAYGVPTSG